MYINQLELQTKNKKVDVLEDGVHVKAARKTADLPGCDSNRYDATASPSMVTG